MNPLIWSLSRRGFARVVSRNIAISFWGRWKTEINGKAKLVYHVSSLEVIEPEVREVGFTKDFGYGFYVTKIRSQAEVWAKRKSVNTPILSVYSFRRDYRSYNCKLFEEINDEWVDFIADCRRGISHSYDIVEGPMADDKVWNFVEDYISGRIPREVFYSLL